MADAITDAAEARRKAHEQWRKDDLTRALLEERQGYVNRAAAAEDEGDERVAARFTSRVDQVDAELKRIGSEDKIPGARPERKPRKAAATSEKAPDGSGSAGGSTGS